MTRRYPTVTYYCISALSTLHMFDFSAILQSFELSAEKTCQNMKEKQLELLTATNKSNKQVNSVKREVVLNSTYNQTMLSSQQNKTWTVTCWRHGDQVNIWRLKLANSTDVNQLLKHRPFHRSTITHNEMSSRKWYSENCNHSGAGFKKKSYVNPINSLTIINITEYINVNINTSLNYIIPLNRRQVCNDL